MFQFDCAPHLCSSCPLQRLGTTPAPVHPREQRALAVPAPTIRMANRLALQFRVATGVEVAIDARAAGRSRMASEARVMDSFGGAVAIAATV